MDTVMKGPFAKEEGGLRINWQRRQCRVVVVSCRQIRRSATATSNVAEVAVVVHLDTKVRNRTPNIIFCNPERNVRLT